MLAAGLIVTAALTVLAHALYDRNESRLLDLRVRELGLVLGSSVPSIQTPLASAAALAAATNGNARRLGPLLAPSVGPGRQFISVSRWPLDAPALAARRPCSAPPPRSPPTPLSPPRSSPASVAPAC